MNDLELSASESAGVIYDEIHEGIRFTFTVEIVSGEEGKQLAMRQARAIRGLLLWARKAGQGPGGLILGSRGTCRILQVDVSDNKT